jgi:hypothetical protein
LDTCKTTNFQICMQKQRCFYFHLIVKHLGWHS